MVIKEKTQEFLERRKEKKSKQRELDSIKQEAYHEAMKEEAAWMGKKQAELEAKHRAELYEKKLAAKRKLAQEQIKKRFKQGGMDVFGLHAHEQQNEVPKQFNIITGRYS